MQRLPFMKIGNFHCPTSNKLCSPFTPLKQLFKISINEKLPFYYQEELPPFYPILCLWHLDGTQWSLLYSRYNQFFWWSYLSSCPVNMNRKKNVYICKAILQLNKLSLTLKRTKNLWERKVRNHNSALNENQSRPMVNTWIK